MGDAVTKRYQGVFLLIIINFITFLLINILHMPLTNMYLNTEHFKWYQFFTALFCHMNYMHLSGNMFFLYIFGRLIEEEEGFFGLMVSYFTCGVGANICYLLFSSKEGYLLGASGAIFGLFSIAMMIKFKPKFFNILEILILAPFVLSSIKSEISMLDSVTNVAHNAHLFGALIGVLLILSLRYLTHKQKT